jgi:hypothetical protein
MSSNVRNYSRRINRISITVFKLVRMLADITKFKNSIVDAKKNELNYYRSIRLSKEEKQRIFQVDGEEIHRQNNKIIVWDPL